MGRWGDVKDSQVYRSFFNDRDLSGPKCQNASRLKSPDGKSVCGGRGSAAIFFIKPAEVWVQRRKIAPILGRICIPEDLPFPCILKDEQNSLGRVEKRDS